MKRAQVNKVVQQLLAPGGIGKWLSRAVHMIHADLMAEVFAPGCTLCD